MYAKMTVRTLDALLPEEDSAAGTQILLTLFRDWKRAQGLPSLGDIH